MKLARKSNDHLKQAYNHYLLGIYISEKWLCQFCLDVWYYGYFDFFIDVLGLLSKKCLSADGQHERFIDMVDIYFSEKYNPNLNIPHDGEPRVDKYEWALKEAPKGKRISISDIFKDNG